MTIDEFLKVLSTLPKKEWYFGFDYCIRNWHNEMETCPITYAANYLKYLEYTISDYEGAGKLLGLNFLDINKIVDAADNNSADTLALRTKLLEITGLWKKEKTVDNA